MGILWHRLRADAAALAAERETRAERLLGANKFAAGDQRGDCGGNREAGGSAANGTQPGATDTGAGASSVECGERLPQIAWSDAWRTTTQHG